MYVEKVNKLYLNAGDFVILRRCIDLLEEIIKESDNSDLEGVTWSDLCLISDGLLNLFDIAESAN